MVLCQQLSHRHSQRNWPFHIEVPFLQAWGMVLLLVDTPEGVSVAVQRNSPFIRIQIGEDLVGLGLGI
jgi:hypothetical protein